MRYNEYIKGKENPTNQKGIFTMKKNVFEMVVAMVNGQSVADMDTLRNEINAEWERMNAKANANKSAYDAAREVAFSILSDEPMTAKALFAAGEGMWPDGFTAAKVQYALLHYWNDSIVKHEVAKGANTYSVK